MTQISNQKTVKKCDFEKISLKNTLSLLRETIDYITSGDFDVNNPKNLAKIVVNLTIVETNLINAMTCVENL